MKYYQLVLDHDHDDMYIGCNKAEIGEMDPYDITKGVKIDNWYLPVLRYKPSLTRELPDYLLNPHDWPVVSDRFLEVMHVLISNQVQVLPVAVVNNFTGRKQRDYFALNILPRPDALDYEKAVFDRFESDEDEAQEAIFIDHCVIKEIMVEGYHIFRLRCSPFEILVSEEFKKHAESAKLTGLDFWEVDVS